jgi:hypothetical protein
MVLLWLWDRRQCRPVIGLVSKGTDDRVGARACAASEPIAVTVHAAGGVPTSQPTHVACTCATTAGNPTRDDESVANCVSNYFRLVVQIEQNEHEQQIASVSIRLQTCQAHALERI